MSWLWWLILGVLVGWIVEWVIDWLFWRRRNTDADSSLQARVQQLEAEFNRARADNGRLQQDLSAARAEAQQHKAALAPLETSLADCQQRYKQIQAEQNNVEPVANTLILPAETSAPRREPVADSDNKTMFLPAEALAPKSEPMVEDSKKTVLLSAEEVAQALETSDKPLNSNQTMLLALDDATPATQAAALTEQALGAAETPAQRDALIDIDGIGPVYERRLFAAGILTFAQLAALTPERVREIINPESWQSIDTEGWIAEARQFAERAEGSQEV